MEVENCQIFVRIVDVSVGRSVFCIYFIQYMEKDKMFVVCLLHNKLIPDMFSRPLVVLFPCSFNRDLLSYHLFGRTLNTLNTKMAAACITHLRLPHTKVLSQLDFTFSSTCDLRKKKTPPHPLNIIAIKLKQQSNYIMWHQANPNPNTNPNPNPCINPNLAH